jgi:hypothetical protein
MMMKQCSIYCNNCLFYHYTKITPFFLSYKNLGWGGKITITLFYFSFNNMLNDFIFVNTTRNTKADYISAFIPTAEHYD